MKSIKISFLVSGHAHQRITLLGGLSIKALLEGLNDGTFVTSLSESAIVYSSDLSKQVALIVETTNCAEYTSFEEET